MKISEVTWRAPVVVDCDATIEAACRLMDRQGVGALIVVDGEIPIGIITDRDVVTRGVAHGVPLDGRVDGLMSMGLIGLDPTDDLDDLFALFSHHAVRRVPIIDHDRIVGVVSLDDAIVLLSGNMAELAKVLSAQILFPHAGDEPAAPALT